MKIKWLILCIVWFFLLSCATTKKTPSEMLKETEIRLTPVATTTITATQPEKVVSPPEIIRAEKPEGPAELKENIPPMVKVISELPTGEYKLLNLTSGYKMKEVEEKIRKSGLFPYSHPEEIILRTFNQKGKPSVGRVPPWTLILYKCSADAKGVRLCRPDSIAQCGNRTDKFWLEFHPAEQVWIERYRDKEILKTTERYRDTVTVFKKIILPPPPPKKVKWEWPKEIDYGGGNGGGGGGGCSGSGASR